VTQTSPGEFSNVGVFRLRPLSPRLGITLTALCFVAMTVVFLPLFAVFRSAAGLFALVPVVTAAWSLGGYAGAAAGAIAITLMTVLLARSDLVPPNELVTPSVVARAAALMFVGFAVGRFRDLLVETVRAVDDRNRADRALREAESKYRNLVEHSLTGVYIIQDERFVYANPRLCELYGYTREELFALASYLDLALEEDRPRILDSVRRRLTGEQETAHYTARARRKDGQVIRLEILGGRTEFLGRPAVIGTILDITERVRVEEALRESEERFRRVFEEGPLGMALVGQDFRMLKVNRALCRMLGYSEQELTGLAFTEITYPEDIQTDVELSRQVFEGKIPSFSIEKRYLTKGGDIFYGMLTASVLRDEAGRPHYGLGMIEDVTVRKRMADQLLRADRLESIGQLAGGVAHNFNNALTAIFGYSELAMRHLDEGHPSRADIERIQHVAEQSAALTRQLLAFSRRQRVDERAFDLNEAVAAAEALFRPLLGDQLQLVFRLRPGLGRVLADRGQIEQVITNLVLNARDAMPGGGTLTVDTCRIEVDEAFARAHPDAHPAVYARLTVSDTGTGMDEATQARIFDPFFTTKQPGQGVGLGLAMAHGAVRQTGGFITVRSRPGKGSSFSVYLPSAQDPGARDGVEPSSAETKVE